MSQQDSEKFVDWNDCILFLSSCLSIYGLSDGQLELTKSDDFLAFYSRPFLRKRKWSIVPLWEGDLRVLLMDRHEKFPLLTALKDRCLVNGAQFLYRATIELTNAPYWRLDLEKKAGDAAITIATRKFDLRVVDPNELFELTDTHVPYWGHNFLWTSDERFVIYTNGDNAAFIAGDRHEVENFLGVTYEYCLDRFISANVGHSGWTELIVPYTRFCEEFA